MKKKTVYRKLTKKEWLDAMDNIAADGSWYSIMTDKHINDFTMAVAAMRYVAENAADKITIMQQEETK